MKVFYFIICILIFYQCKNTKNIQEYPTLNVTIEGDFQGIPADSLFSSVTYIPLETSKHSLLASMNKVQIHDSTIYILDKKQEIIFAFDSDGKYKNKLDKHGRGRGEYLSLDDFFITDSIIYILASDQQKISVYNSNFEFNFDFPIATHGTSITFSNDSLFIFTNYCSTELKNFYIYNRFTGEYLDKFGDFSQKQLGVAYKQMTFANYRNSVYCFFPYDYSIYKCHGKLEKVCNINFGKSYMYPSDLKNYSDEERTNYITRYADPLQQPIGRINNLFICDNFLFFTFVKGIFPYIYFKHAKQEVAHVGSIIHSHQFPLINNDFVYIDENTYICFCQAESILSLEEKPHNLQSVKIDDNPILGLYKLKCYEIVYSNLLPHCKWSGYQDDYCPWEN